MPSTSSHVAERRARVARLERLARTLDSQFKLPGLGFRIGWDSILGLVPGLGDLVTAGPAAAMIYEGLRLGVRKRALGRMGLNTGIDMTLGAVPLLGDVFDALFKAHHRNVGILKDELARIERVEEKEEEKWQRDTGRKTDAATARRRSAPRAGSHSQDGRAARSSAALRAGTK